MLYHTEMSTVVERTLVVPTVKEYLHSTLSMLRAAESGEIAKMLNITHSPSLTMLDIRREVCKNFQKLYSNLDTLHDWNIFLSAAL